MDSNLTRHVPKFNVGVTHKGVDIMALEHYLRSWITTHEESGFEMRRYPAIFTASDLGDPLAAPGGICYHTIWIWGRFGGDGTSLA